MAYAREGAIVVKGNHDEAVAQRSPRYLNDAARDAIEWARGSLTQEEKDFLDALPLCVRERDLCLVHASAAIPERWEYVDSPSAALRSMQAAAAIHTFSGHVHDQLLFAQVGADTVTRFRPHHGSPVPVARHRRWLALVGSVGQPRDGNPAAGYALFDEARTSLTYFRIPYDHRGAAGKIRAAGLPESLAFRVQRGI